MNNKDIIIEISKDFGIPVIVAKKLFRQYETKDAVLNHIKNSTGSLAPYMLDYHESDTVKKKRKIISYLIEK
jgi:hypothetical protein